jgi:cardiolipin synthase
VRLLYENGKAMLSHNNQIEFIYSGDQKINQLYQDIQNARQSIHLEYFSILNDNTGRYLRDLLNEKLIEGVEVRVIYDAVGSWRTGKRFWRKLIRNGGECYAFSPVVLPFLSSKLNYRDHRKIAVIDNSISYIGGVNIGNQYMGLSKKFSYWRDTHLRIRGEASNLIQRMFLLDWMFVSNKNVFNEKYFSEPTIKEGVPVQIISSGPDSDWENIHQAYFAMISSAKHYIYISTPYMLLDDSILMALKIAGLSGVDVRIMLPKVSDHKFVHYASRSYYYELIQAKVGIYEYHKGFMHAKMIIVDDEFCSVGSANLDIRSFSQNFEINALIYDKNKTIELKNQFIEDLTYCIEIQYDRFTKRPVFKRFIESVARLFSPVM